MPAITPLMWFTVGRNIENMSLEMIISHRYTGNQILQHNTSGLNKK
jgi:hypothetical protein